MDGGIQENTIDKTRQELIQTLVLDFSVIL